MSYTACHDDSARVEAARADCRHHNVNRVRSSIRESGKGIGDGKDSAARHMGVGLQSWNLEGVKPLLFRFSRLYFDFTL